MRAALIGLGMFQRTTYSTKVFTELDLALGWLLAGPEGDGDVRTAMKVIKESRGGSSKSDPYAAPQISRRMSK